MSKSVFSIVGVLATLALGCVAILAKSHWDNARLQAWGQSQKAWQDPDSIMFGGPFHKRLARVGIFETNQDPQFRRTIRPEDQCETVIGVVIDNEAFAFSTREMAIRSNHLVGFQVQQQSYVVSHCNISGCTRVFGAGESDQSPEDLSVMGLQVDGKMVVRLEDQLYQQDSAELPLEDVDFQVMKLWEWQRNHPDSQYFLEQEPAAP